MPNRIIKESICTSDNLDALSTFNENTFYRLLVNCDDYGRMDARPKVLAARLYPLKDIRASQMAEALRALSSAELVTLYEVDGKPFLQMKTWERHQQIRAQKSKYPPFDGEMQARDITCNQMISDDSKCPRNPIQSESNPNPNPNPSDSTDAGVRFEEFWKAYPKKVGKDAARTAFKKRKPSQALVAEMLSAISAQKSSEQWTKNGGQFIPNPATWLNQGRWQDEVKAKEHGYGENALTDADAARLMVDLDAEDMPI